MSVLLDGENLLRVFGGIQCLLTSVARPACIVAFSHCPGFVNKCQYVHRVSAMQDQWGLTHHEVLCIYSCWKYLNVILFPQDPASRQVSVLAGKIKTFFLTSKGKYVSGEVQPPRNFCYKCQKVTFGCAVNNCWHHICCKQNVTFLILTSAICHEINCSWKNQLPKCLIVNCGLNSGGVPEG